jgi:hypothetical protein
MVGNILEMDTPLKKKFSGKLAYNSSKATKECCPPNTSFLVWGGFFIVMKFLVRECYGSPKKHEF